jgi:ABC-type branched-subunit amino acid transport system substrate-binding protein
MALLLTGCSGISFLKTTPQDLYSEPFLKQVESVKKLYRQGEVNQALKVLQKIEDNKITTQEQGMKYNLLGVIQFSRKEYQKAITTFDQALNMATSDPLLQAQIRLNLASCYYKLSFMEKAYETLRGGDANVLTPEESGKYYRLRFRLAKELGRESEELDTVAQILSSKTTQTEVRGDPYYEILSAGFNKLDDDQKLKFVERFSDPPNFAVGYLAYYHAEKIYYEGKKNQANDILDWLTKRFSGFEQIKSLAEGFSYRMQNVARMDSNIIGVVLPLTGDKKALGERALLGMDVVLQALKRNKKVEYAPSIIIRDSEGVPSLGAMKVKELVEKHYASAVVGGLFVEEAVREYLEAKKHGVLFISLAPIYLPREKKDHLLIEIPGSVESQMNLLFSPPVLERFGKNAAILYPEGAQGQAYVDEFWRQSLSKNVQVAGIISYDKSTTDFRGPVKRILGLDSNRSRQEEYDLFSDVYANEKSSVRRIQILRPQVHFGWIFLVANPKEAMQIIPSFSYFDAFNVNFWGGPSWRSNLMQNYSSRMGKVFFVSDYEEDKENDFTKEFQRLNKMPAKILESRAYDALNLVVKILVGSKITEREEFDSVLRDKKTLMGTTGVWNLEDGLWIKDMVPLQYKNTQLAKMFGPEDGVILKTGSE